jgi:oligoendopeptidase F
MSSLPQAFEVARNWTWDVFVPYYQALQEAELKEATIDAWLQQWNDLYRTLNEVNIRLKVQADQNTADEDARQAYADFMKDIFPKIEESQIKLQKKLVDSGIRGQGLDPLIRTLHGKLQIFREENLPLLARQEELVQSYNQVTGAQTAQWEGEEISLQRLYPYMRSPDRELREKANRVLEERHLQDNDKINEIWRDLMDVRKQLSENADMDNFRSYQWLRLGRVDYKAQEIIEFCESIEKVVVPVTKGFHEKRRAKMGLDKLRPWDTGVDLEGREPLKPFETVEEFIEKSKSVFKHVDPELGRLFAEFHEAGALDLENRKNKTASGYMKMFAVSKTPFIFMHAVGAASDVNTLLHEAGHAFHGVYMLERYKVAQSDIPMEIAELASMAMELLAAPYLTEEYGGFFNEADGARYRLKRLKNCIGNLPDIAVPVLFQHWIYTHHEQASDPEACDEKWAELRRRFFPTIDYEGVEPYLRNSWRRWGHFFWSPFYMIEYAMAQLGAIQIWANSLKDQSAALEAYRSALKLSYSVPLPELYEAAGAKFAFDEATIQAAVDLLEQTIEELEQVVNAS